MSLKRSGLVALAVVVALASGCRKKDVALVPPTTTGGAGGGTASGGAGGAIAEGGAGGSIAHGGAGGATASGGAGGAIAHGGAGGATTTSAPAIATTLAAAGFTVQPGVFSLFDPGDCCKLGGNCAGNNPSSPYATFLVPRAPGQQVANPGEDAKGLSSSFRLGLEEAVVWVGELPPKAGYFGFTPYLFDRDDGSGNRVKVFASLSETLNDLVIGSDGAAGDPFGHQAVVVLAADASVAAKVKDAAVAAGWPAGAVNVLPIDASTARPGLDEKDDSFGVLLRLAQVEDAAAGKAWLAKLPAEVYRVTPGGPYPNPVPYGKADARPKDAANVEGPDLAAALDELEQAIVAAHAATHGATPHPVSVSPLDPYACIANLKSCLGDNRDTNYPATKLFKWLPGAEDFLVVYGVDHAKTKKATYANASVYAVQHLIGVAAVASDAWAGSASQYLPNHPLADELYAYRIARACDGAPYCLEIASQQCPDGIAPGAYSAIAFRAYLEPSTATAPDPATMVLDRVIELTKK
jgi:hypothetical protein